MAEKEAELKECEAKVETAREQKTELGEELIQLQRNLDGQRAILGDLQTSVALTTEDVQKRKRELDATEASYNSKKAKMKELQTGDAVAFANIMYWHMLGEDHFDLSRIVSALGVRGEAEDLSMIRVIERIQRISSTGSQTRAAKSTHSDTGRVGVNPQEQLPEGADSGEAEKSPTESVSEELEESTEEPENSTNLTGPLSALKTKDDDSKLPISTA